MNNPREIVRKFQDQLKPICSAKNNQRGLVAPEYFPSHFVDKLPLRIQDVQNVINESTQRAAESRMESLSLPSTSFCRNCSCTDCLNMSAVGPSDQSFGPNYDVIMQSFEQFLDGQRQQFKSFLTSIMQAPNNSHLQLPPCQKLMQTSGLGQSTKECVSLESSKSGWNEITPNCYSSPGDKSALALFDKRKLTERTVASNDKNCFLISSPDVERTHERDIAPVKIRSTTFTSRSDETNLPDADAQCSKSSALPMNSKNSTPMGEEQKFSDDNTLGNYVRQQSASDMKKTLNHDETLKKVPIVLVKRVECSEPAAPMKSTRSGRVVKNPSCFWWGASRLSKLKPENSSQESACMTLSSTSSAGNVRKRGRRPNIAKSNSQNCSRKRNADCTSDSVNKENKKKISKKSDHLTETKRNASCKEGRTLWNGHSEAPPLDVNSTANLTSPLDSQIPSEKVRNKRVFAKNIPNTYTQSSSKKDVQSEQDSTVMVQKSAVLKMRKKAALSSQSSRISSDQPENINQNQRTIDSRDLLAESFLSAQKVKKARKTERKPEALTSTHLKKDSGSTAVKSNFKSLSLSKKKGKTKNSGTQLDPCRSKDVHNKLQETSNNCTEGEFICFFEDESVVEEAGNM